MVFGYTILFFDFNTSHNLSCKYYFQFYGGICRVYETSANGTVSVTTKQQLGRFSPKFLTVHDDLASLPWSNPLPNADHLETLKHYLKQHSNQVHVYELQHWSNKSDMFPTLSLVLTLSHRFMAMRRQTD